MNIEVKISFDKTAAGLIQELINAIAGLALALNKLAPTDKNKSQNEVQAPPAAAPINPQPAEQQQLSITTPQPPAQPSIQPPAQPAAVPTSAQTYTMEQLAVAATQLMDAGRRAELVNLLNQFGVQALTALPKEQYGAFATQLRAMGAKI